MTVGELLTGKKEPLSMSEFIHWMAYRVVHNEREEASSKKSNKGKSAEDRKIDTDVGRPTTMGQRQ